MAMVLFFILYFIQAPVKGELYSALAGMEALLATQHTIINTLDDYIETSEKKIEKLKVLKESYNQLYNVSKTNFQDFVSNPINAFVLIKKLSIDWNETIKLMNCSQTTGLSTVDVIFPDENDLSGAAKALLRVQETYGLDTVDLSEGKIDGAPVGLPLSIDDSFELGRQAIYASHYDSATSWLELTKEKCQEHNSNYKSCSEVLSYISLSNEEKEKNDFMDFTKQLLQLSFMSVSETFENHLQLIVASLNEPEKNIVMGQANIYDEAVYRRLCKTSTQVLSARYSPYLRCHLVPHHPYFFLMPVKEEELCIEPKISLFYDIISDSEIEIMKSLALPVLERAEVVNYNEDLERRVSDARVNKIAWLRKNDHPLVSKMYRRIEDITGLSSTTAELLQMANYGPGGHFQLHMDVLFNDTESYFNAGMGNRIATWLTYLSDVKGGGATVFPRLNITVSPKKGSALFWHNMKSNGLGDIMTLHGGCPVVRGSKWITNVWFHERGQEFRLKCGKHPESSMQPVKIL